MAETLDIALVYARTEKAYHATFPLRVFRSRIESAGIKLHFFNDLYAKAINDCPTLCVIYGDRYRLKGFDERYEAASSALFVETLERYRSRGHKVILIDDQDTTGNIRSVMIDAADVYAKAQILRDRSLYMQPMYAKLYYKDFLHRKYALNETSDEYGEALKEAQIAKLTLAWNYGLNDWRLKRLRGIYYHLYRRFPRSVFKVDPSNKPLKERRIDASLRVGLHGYSALTNFHRTQASDKLAALKDRYTIVAGGKLDIEDYRRELQDTKIIPSPYGLGEICYRDFEAFEAGALLLKPTMEYIDTYPAYYKPSQTYIAHAIDLSDYAETLDRLLSDIGEHQDIATAGQQHWLNSLNDAEGFALHFERLVKRSSNGA